MAVIQIRATATGTVLGQVDIPDTAIPRLKTGFGGGTNAEVAAAVLTWLVPALRKETVQRVLASKWTADYAAVNTGQATEATAVNNDWP